MKIIKKEPDKDYEIIEVNVESQYGLKNVLNGSPDFVYISNNLKYVVDEDGFQKRLPVNFCIKTTSHVYPIVKLMGTVLMIRTKPVYSFGEYDDDRIVDLKQGDIDLFEQTLMLSELLPIPYYPGYDK